MASYWSPFDEQCGNLVALECEVVAELDRTSWKAAADIGIVTRREQRSEIGVRDHGSVRSIVVCALAVLVYLIGVLLMLRFLKGAK